MSEITYEKISKIVLEVTTCTEKRSSTNDPIILFIGDHKWVLDDPAKDDFEKGNIDTFNLKVPFGMDASWFRYLCFRKTTQIVKDDDWCLKKVKLIINDKIVYEKDNINAWLKQDKSSWCASDFKYGKAGEK